MASEKEVNPAVGGAGAARDPRRMIGARGEEIAADFFMRRGYDIAARNWRRGGGELDLVVRKGDEYRVVEVKARRSLRAGQPEESVTDDKLLRLDDLARQFFEERDLLDPAYHIDVFSVVFRPDGGTDVRHLPDVG
jgi:putative endonuclease